MATLFFATPGQRADAQGGMATAAPQKAQFDNLHRPITAGGFVKDGPVIFQNVAEAAGLTRWHHTAGTPEKKTHSRGEGARGLPF